MEHIFIAILFLCGRLMATFSVRSYVTKPRRIQPVYSLATILVCLCDGGSLYPVSCLVFLIQLLSSFKETETNDPLIIGFIVIGILVIVIAARVR